MTARPSTKRAPRRLKATGGRPSPPPPPSAQEADDIIESLVRSISTVIREELLRVRPVLVAGLEAGADYRLCSPSAVRRLRARVGDPSRKRRPRSTSRRLRARVGEAPSS